MVQTAGHCGWNSKNRSLRNPKVHSFYREIVDSYNKYFSHTEQVKKFELLPQEWTIETGEMTPKLSLRRKVVTEKFHDRIETYLFLRLPLPISSSPREL